MANSGNQSIVRELLIQVKNKNLKATVEAVHKLEGHLTESAVAAELLDNALDPIPASLKKIIREAEDLEATFGTIGTGGKSMEGVETQLDMLNGSFDELLGAVAELQDAFTTGLSRSAERAERSMHDLLVSSERAEDGINGVTGALGRQNTQNKKGNPAWQERIKNQEKFNRNNSNTAKGFSSIARAGGSLTIAYAVIAANVYALTAAFDQLMQGAQLNRLEEVGSVMGASIGVPIQFIASEMQKATGYTIAYEEALRQASSASTFGFTTKEITGMTIAARRASVALGVDMNDALNRIIRGVSKLEIELLDELGITVRLTEAYDTYAESIGTSADALTSYQKQRAYLNAVLKESEERQGQIDPYLEANGWELMGANISSATNRLRQWVADAAEPAAKVMAEYLSEGDLSKNTRSVEAFSDTMLKASESGRGSMFATLASNFSEGDAELAKLERSVAEATQTMFEYDDSMAGASRSWNYLAQLIYRDISRPKMVQDILDAEKKIEDYKASLKSLAGSAAGVDEVTEEFAVQRDELYKSAKALKNFGETYDTISAGIRGTNESFEIMDKYLSDTNDLTSEAARLMEDMKDVFKDMGITGDDYLKLVATSSANLRNEFELQATMQERVLRVQEEAYAKGIPAAETSLKVLRMEREALEASLKTKIDGKAADSALLAIRSQITASKLQELEIERQIYTERTAFLAANDAFTSQFLRFSGVYDAHLTDVEYEGMLLQDRLATAMREFDAMKGIEGLTTERLNKETEILKIKQEQVDLEAQKAREDLSQNQGEAMTLATNAGGIGPMAMQEIQLAESRKLANDQLDKGVISRTKYDEIMRQSNMDEIALEQAKLEQIASVNDLFLARTGQQSIIAMNAEELLGYQKEIGASMYESARSALDSMDPVMGSMFDGLQKFGVALTQVGNTSQGVWNGVSAGVEAAAGVMSFMSDKAVADIDKQIAAEKKKDGKSAESLKKIAAMEAKQAKIKENSQKKAIIANTAVGIMQAISTSTDIYSGMALAAIVAGMGVMQLSALDSGNFADVAGSDVTSLELGERNNSVDLSRGATSGELAYIRGSGGVGGIQDFVPRARGSNTSPNVRYLTGEHGVEAISGSNSGGTSVDSTENISNSKSQSVNLTMQINALDSKSILDRSEDILAALEEAAQARGFSIGGGGL